MQIENRKNVIVHSVVLVGNAIHGVHLHCFASSIETRLAISQIATSVKTEPIPSTHSDATPAARVRKLHVPVNTQATSCAFDNPRRRPLHQFHTFSATAHDEPTLS